MLAQPVLFSTSQAQTLPLILPPQSHVLLFYIKPLIAKWLKTYKTPRVLVVSDTVIDRACFEKGLHASFLECVGTNLCFQMPQSPSWDMVIAVCDGLPSELLPLLKQRVVPGGVMLWAYPKRHKDLSPLHTAIEQQDIVDPYIVGFHPYGAVAWWPLKTPGLTWLGKLLDALMTFFPGRYELGLAYGQYHLMRGFKRYSQTDFNDLPEEA